MAVLTDSSTLTAIKYALSHWDGHGDVQWKELPLRWIRDNLETSAREIARLMHLHVEAGKPIDQVVERREEWRTLFPFHYDFRMEIEGQCRYIETVLNSESRMQPPHLLIVNMHNCNP